MATGDSLAWLASLPDGCADALVTAPPYTAAGGNTNGRSSGADAQFWSFWFSSMFLEMARVLKPEACGFIFCDWRMVGAAAAVVRGSIDRQRATAWEATQALVWDRENIGLGAPFRNSYEMILFVRGPSWKHDPEVIPRNIPSVIKHRYTYGKHAHHGAEKPVELLRQLIRWSCPPGGVVLDPFAGSGSAGVAAMEEGRGYLGCEIDPAYSDTAHDRIAAAMKARAAAE